MTHKENNEIEYLRYKKLIRNLRLRKNEKSTFKIIKCNISKTKEGKDN